MAGASHPAVLRWVVNNLIPVVVVVGVVFGVFGLATWGLATLYDKYRQHW